MNKICLCGCDSFHVQKVRHQYVLVCQRCKCQRSIISPGIGVSKYDVTTPFKPEETHAA